MSRSTDPPGGGEPPGDRPCTLREGPAPGPREKIVAAGSRALTTTELLTLLVGRPRREPDRHAVAERVLRQYGAERLPTLELADWKRIPGVGISTAVRLVAGFELARRCANDTPKEAIHVSSPREAYAQVKDLATATKEHLVGLYLDAQNCLIVRETLSVGTLNTTRTHPREVLQPAILHHALGFILVHNHPSGSLVPSRDDVEFTRAMRRAAEIMGVELYDHLVVGADGFVSLKEKGLI